jgi:hypothetical protein
VTAHLLDRIMLCQNGFGKRERKPLILLAVSRGHFHVKTTALRHDKGCGARWRALEILFQSGGAHPVEARKIAAFVSTLHQGDKIKCKL